MNIGILGAGRIAAQMADTINCMEGMKAYAIASRQLEKAAAFFCKRKPCGEGIWDI